METQMLLRDPDIFPSEEVLRNALGETNYNLFQEFVQNITSPTSGLAMEWRYYNDGKAWLCKVVNKKKTVFWLSIWEHYFKTSFYFTEKHLESIDALSIADSLKQQLAQAKSIGKLIPLIIDVQNDEAMTDLLALIHFKKSLK